MYSIFETYDMCHSLEVLLEWERGFYKDKPYDKEEAVAEIGEDMLCAHWMTQRWTR